VRILLIGDIVGKPGRRIVARALRGLKQREAIDVAIANGENAADGSGITPKIYKALIDAGVDCVTMGDHIYRRWEISSTLETESNIVKPANFPSAAPGRKWTVVPGGQGADVGIFSLLGRVFMRPVDCPWQTADQVLEEMPQNVKVKILDFHAEATSDKQLMGRYLDGRVSAVLGTHTHVATADEQILPGGTAFQCDVGMTGAYESILGREIQSVLETTLSFCPSHFQVAKRDVRLCGTIVDIEPDTGRAAAIRRLVVSEAEADQLAAAVPDSQRERGSTNDE
jgi:metallophosphoesterase (TIGR00282 family)